MQIMVHEKEAATSLLQNAVMVRLSVVAKTCSASLRSRQSNGHCGEFSVIALLAAFC
jgi:hypothetical protein